MDIHSVIIGPHITEKGTILKEMNNQIVLKVAKAANKVQIKEAVEKLLKKKVIDVKTINVRGKRRRMGRFQGKRPDWKKAIVRLAPGEKIEFFEGV